MLYGIRAHEQPTSTPRGQVNGRDARDVFPPREYCGAVLYRANDVGLVLCCGSASYLAEPHQSPYFPSYFACFARGVAGFRRFHVGQALEVHLLSWTHARTCDIPPPSPPGDRCGVCNCFALRNTSNRCFCVCVLSLFLYLYSLSFFSLCLLSIIIIIIIIATKETDAIM